MPVGDHRASKPPGERGSASGPGDSDARRVGGLPSASGGIARLACARASAAGIELAPLLKSARLTVQQIEDRNARLPVQSQIRLLKVAASAWLLGYQEVSAFTHAFKRWTGVTPRKMRTKAEPTHDSK